MDPEKTEVDPVKNDDDDDLETKNRRLEVLDYVESLGSPNSHAPRTKIVIGEEEEEPREEILITEDEETTRPPEQAPTTTSGRTRIARAVSRPGAWAVNGVNRMGRGTFDIEEQETATTSSSLPPPPPPQFDAEVVEDEEAVLARVQTRVQDRMRASAVEATDVQAAINEPDDDDKPRTSSSQKAIKERRLKLILCLFGFGAIALVLVLVLMLSSNSSQPGGDIFESTQAPTMSDVEDLQQFLLKLGVSTKVDLYDETTAQYRALQWIVLEDPLMLFQSVKDSIVDNDGIPDGSNSTEMLLERYVIVLLYFVTDGPNSWMKFQNEFLSNTSICEWPSDPAIGVTCSKERPTVIQLDFGKSISS